MLATTDLVPRYWPAVGVGTIVCAYWWRVLRMASRMRRRTGRAANFVPTEPAGRALRIVWQPVVWMWVGLPWHAAFAAAPPLLLRLMVTSQALAWTGVAVAAFAYGATRACWARMGKSWRMGIDPGETTTLVVTGPYAFVRHPIYGLSTLLMAATVAVVPSPAMVVVAIIHAVLLQSEARREELHLSRIHGPAYDRYRDRTGRFLPRAGRRPEGDPAAL